MTKKYNLSDILSSASAEVPEKLAYQFVYEDSYQTFTYRQLEIKAKAIAATLQQYSCQGERCMLLLPPGLDYIAAFFGCLYANVIAVPAYPPKKNHHGHRLHAICENAQAKFILTNAIFIEHCPAAPHIIALDTIQEIMADEYKNIQHDLADLAFLQYTSGSTSLPKGVMISHDNILTNLEIIRHYFSEKSEKICSWLPPYHDMGLIGGILYPLYVRQFTYLMTPTYFLQSPLRWLELISREKITTSVAPNFAYELCVKKILPEQIQHLDLSCWQYALNGAEPIHYETLKKFFNLFAAAGLSADTIRPVYGLAENTLIVSAADARKWYEPCFVSRNSLGSSKRIDVRENQNENTSALISCGRDPINHSIQIVNPDTLQPLQEGEIGEIWVSGPSVAKGYWNDSELTQKILHATLPDRPILNFLRTGDLGFKYKKELFITGRAKDLIIINGANHYPQDIEQTVSESHPALQPHGTAVFSQETHDNAGLIILQEMSRTYLNKLNNDEIIDAIQTSVLIKHGLQIQSIVLVKPHSLPKTSSGKIQRWKCREMFNSNEKFFVFKWDRAEKKYSELNSNDTNDALINWLQEWSAKRSHLIPKINTHDTLAQYGFDSILAAELAADLQNYLQKPIDPAAILEQKTWMDLINFIKNLDNIHPQAAPKSLKKIPLVKSTTHPLNHSAKHIYFNTTHGISRDTIALDGKHLINYAGYNYLGMSGDPFVTAAVIEAVKEYGTSASASRIASGQKPLHAQLEKAIADLIGTEDCLVYSSGHATNVSVISHLFGPNDLIVHDSLCHNSILQGAVFSGAKRLTFPHNNYDALQTLLEKWRHSYERALIISEGIFSMDGDIPDVPRLIQLKQDYLSFLMLDEAHSIGTLGKTGAGIREHFNLNPLDVDIWMGTLSKAFASCGGYIAGSHELIENLKFNAAGFVYSAGISPANTAAALAAIQLMQQEPQRVTTLQQRHKLLLALLKQNQIETGICSDTPVIPLMTHNEMAAMSLSLNLKENGIYAIPIFYPAVEKGKARVRLFVNSLHTEEQIYYTAKTIQHCYEDLRVE